MEAGEHKSELGQWQTVQRRADPRLRAYVHGYFASSSNLRMPLQERHLPSTEVPLLLNFGAPHRRLDAVGTGEWTSRDGVWVVGLHNRHQLTKAAGERHFMVVRFTPMGAYLFLGLPMHLIANEALDLELIRSWHCDRVETETHAPGRVKRSELVAITKPGPAPRWVLPQARA